MCRRENAETRQGSDHMQSEIQYFHDFVDKCLTLYRGQANSVTGDKNASADEKKFRFHKFT